MTLTKSFCDSFRMQSINLYDYLKKINPLDKKVGNIPAKNVIYVGDSERKFARPAMMWKKKLEECSQYGYCSLDLESDVQEQTLALIIIGVPDGTTLIFDVRDEEEGTTTKDRTTEVIKKTVKDLLQNKDVTKIGSGINQDFEVLIQHQVNMEPLMDSQKLYHRYKEEVFKDFEQIDRPGINNLARCLFNVPFKNALNRGKKSKNKEEYKLYVKRIMSFYRWTTPLKEEQKMYLHGDAMTPIAAFEACAQYEIQQFVPENPLWTRELRKCEGNLQLMKELTNRVMGLYEEELEDTPKPRREIRPEVDITMSMEEENMLRGIRNEKGEIEEGSLLAEDEIDENAQTSEDEVMVLEDEDEDNTTVPTLRKDNSSQTSQEDTMPVTREIPIIVKNSSPVTIHDTDNPEEDLRERLTRISDANRKRRYEEIPKMTLEEKIQRILIKAGQDIDKVKVLCEVRKRRKIDVENKVIIPQKASMECKEDESCYATHFRSLCVKCGEGGHFKRHCVRTVNCRYPPCSMRRGDHAMRCCPVLHSICRRCHHRGHLASECETIPEIVLARRYETFCKYGLFTKHQEDDHWHY